MHFSNIPQCTFLLKEQTIVVKSYKHMIFTEEENLECSIFYLVSLSSETHETYLSKAKYTSEREHSASKTKELIVSSNQVQVLFFDRKLSIN